MPRRRIRSEHVPCPVQGAEPEDGIEQAVTAIHFTADASSEHGYCVVVDTVAGAFACSIAQSRA
jgi:hypothetical protein